MMVLSAKKKKGKGGCRALLLALVALGCGPVRTGATVLTPGAPLPDRCDAAGATRCDGLRVLTCSGTGREWEALAGSCAYGCEDTDAGARCTARDAGVTP